MKNKEKEETQILMARVSSPTLWSMMSTQALFLQSQWMVGLSLPPLCLTIFCLAFPCGETFLFSFLIFYWPSSSRGPCLSIQPELKLSYPSQCSAQSLACLGPSLDSRESLRTQMGSHSVSGSFHRHNKSDVHLGQITKYLLWLSFILWERSFCSF